MPAAPRIIPADTLPRWSRYAAMLRDCGHDGLGRADGVLHLEELKGYVESLQRDRVERVRNRESTGDLDLRLRESSQLYADMQAANVDGVSYLPQSLLDLDLGPILNRRCVELLMVDDDLKLGHVSQDVLDRGRARYHAMDSRSVHLLEVKRQALEDLDDLADRLGLL
jgi:hypothetical protein